MTHDTTGNSYDGEQRTHTLADGSRIDLYWSATLARYVTIPDTSEYEHEPLDVTCPLCGAAPGHPCVDPTTGSNPLPFDCHPERSDGLEMCADCGQPVVYEDDDYWHVDPQRSCFLYGARSERDPR